MISTKGRYALRVMVDLAENSKNGFIPLKDIAERQQISKKYLEIIVKELVSGGFIEGASGRGGGYRLCRDADEYNIGEILKKMEGTLACVSCLSENAKECPRRTECRTLPMWSEFNNLVHEYFYGKKLSSLMHKA